MKFILKGVFVILVCVGVYACASTGSPDGGPYDEMPPRFVRATPEPNATNNERKKISIEFDEFIQLERASEKVIISPPQQEMPEVKVNGKRVQVEFFDSLRANTTYTIDFGDAIVDNNEGNPLGNFSYAFATGDTIDSLQVSGIVLNAENLEPIKGIQVGLHKNLADTAFVKLPFDRISRTDSRGKFTIRGLAPGEYRIYALMDGNQNYLFDSKTEAIAFTDSLVIPSSIPDSRQDTVWSETDTAAIDTIIHVDYTRFLPDNILLRAFKEENQMQYLRVKERPNTRQFVLTFSAKADTLPMLKGLNFDEKDAFIIEPRTGNDSIVYWIKDPMLCEKDTLTIQLDYLATDTLGRLVPQRDTINMLNKIPRERRLAMKEEADKQKEKERRRKERQGDTVTVETEFIPMTLDVPGMLDLDKNILVNFEEPIMSVDTSRIHLSVMIDSVWQDTPFIIRPDTAVYRQYEILASWEPGAEYELRIDSLCFKGLYGLYNDKDKKSFKIKTLEDYGTLYLNIIGAESHAIVQLLDGRDQVVREQPVTSQKTCDFYFLQPSTKYYIRLFNDVNNNGKWDTGDFTGKRQPEEVFYFPKVWEMKANFEFEETWDLHAVPLEKQKLDEIKKQKPDATKKIKERNKERAQRLGRT